MPICKESCTNLFVVVRLPFTMRVEVETDLKLPIPPPMLFIPSRPPMEDEKEVKSTEKEQVIREGKEKKEEKKKNLMQHYITTLSLPWFHIHFVRFPGGLCNCLPPAEGKEKNRLGPRREDEPPKDEKSSG